MRTIIFRAPSNSPRAVHALIVIAIVLLCISADVKAQGSTDGTTPLGLTPGSPSGTYPLSDLDSVNLYNGTLSFRLPIFQIAGRGGAAYPITVQVGRKWTVYRHFEPGVGYFYYADGSWWSENTGTVAFLDVGRLQVRTGWREQPTGVAVEGLTRVTFTAPDGTEYEFRDQLSNGQPKAPVSGGFNRGTIFVTADGTTATFISDSDIHETAYGAEPMPADGYVKLKDGTHFRIDDGVVTWMRDRNGNKITFGRDVMTRVTSITDSLNRVVTITYPTTTTGFTQISFKGYGGATRTIKIGQTNLANALRSGYTMQTGSQLFPEMSAVWYIDATVVNYIELPDGRSYQLRYNPYGELARVVLPTGGAIEYDYAAGLTDGAASGVFSYSFPPTEKYIYRRVIERRVYPDGGSGSGYESKMTYSRPETTTTNLGYVITEQRNASGTLLTKSQHYFYGSPRESFLMRPTHYAAWKDGREYKTEIFDTNGTTILRRVEQTFAQRAAVSWWGGTSDTAPPNDPRTIETVTTLEPATSNLLSKQTFGYDDTVPFNNRNNLKEYNFGSGAAGSLVRETRSTFVTSSSYTDNGVHLRGLLSQVSIYDSGGTERARTVYEYDNYTPVSNHAYLVSRSDISGFDSSFGTGYWTRGNVTAVTKYLLVSGSVTDSVSTYSQYDIAGNVVKAIDGRGYETLFDFTDRFGAPDGNAQAIGGSAELGSQSSYAYATKITNPLLHVAYSQFDFYLGRLVDTEDANGRISSAYYSDALDRLTQVRLAVQAGDPTTQTTFNYDDANRIITTTGDLYSFNDNVLTSKTIYDQLGRTIETRQYEGGSNYIARQTQYDALGRPFKTSNPFRPWQSQTAVWTTQAFDALGRVISVATPDSAVVSTVYSGNTVTITDPAGKARKNVTDALGRLSDIYEDPNGVNYQTTYTYDVLDDLVKVSQGTQQRFFMYDSLKRLIRARIPEQATNASLNLSDPLTSNSAWSVGYQYDAASNVTQKTDPRGVVSTYVYDALNRNATVDYSDTSSINPDIKRFYDGATNGKGRFWYSYTGGDASVGSNVEHTSIDSYDSLGRPLVQRQLFKLNGTWSGTYQTSRTYNPGGRVATQTYPSGHVVTYNYDAAGRVADKDASNLGFAGNLGDGVTRTYSSANTYSEWGSLFMEKFDTQTPLYHKLQYNIRGQLWDVRVATGSDVNGSWNRGALQFFYEPTYTHGASGPTNNGNVLKTNNYLPLDDSSSTWAIHDQFYTYDSLNRLSSASEYFVSSTQASTQTSLQSYTYDRYGNRTINAAQTWGTGINTKQFTVDTATNRLGVPGGQTGVMTYDSAGNLTTDTYSGAGTRTYDAENRMTTAGDYTGQTSRYTYNADGKRTRRQVAGSQEEWQIYGFDGELLAEYRAMTSASSPEKEYGYRNGELLVTATGRHNVALAANGAVATASSAHTCCGFSTTGAINGNNRGPWGNGEGWNDATDNVLPDWIQVDFAGNKSIDEINVFSLHDNYTQENTPTETQTFSLYGLLAFDVQYWNGSSWVTIPGGSVSGNNKVWRKFTFSAITTGKIRVYINSVPDAWSRVVEIQAFGTSAGGEKVQWLVPDHLGTPRIIIDETGNRLNVKRHDYLPFGEELFAGTGGRTVALGYVADGVRQQFTGYERDAESGLDFAGARYAASTQGRFTSVDPLMASAQPANPQTFNRYSYVTNSPLTQVDPTGMFGISPGGSQLGGIGSLGNFSLYGGESVTVTVCELEEDADPQNTPTEENPEVLQAPNNGPACGLIVKFTPNTTNAATGFPNGPSTIIWENHNNFGLGFSVSGWVDEGIGTIGYDAKGKKVPNPENPKGRWSLEQWTHSWIGENGKTILAKKTFPDLSLYSAGLQVKGNTFSYYDHPGGPPPAAGFARYDNYLIKVYNGNKVCEVGFHLIQTGYKIQWAAGLR